MMKFAIALALGSTVAIVAPANAATYNNFNGETGSFGNNNITTSTFNDIFSYSFATAGSLAGTISSTMTDATTDLNFSLVSLQGDEVALDFTTLSTGMVEFRTLATGIAAGSYTVRVSGTSGGAGSYSGVMTFSSAVPEPATWGIMMVGLGVVGGAMRRRKAVTRTTVRFA